MFTMETLTDRLTKKNGYHHGNLRASLIQAALKIILEKGTNGLTIRGVARYANVSHMAPYRHFPDKNALLTEVSRQGFDLMVAQTKARFCRYPDNPLRRLRESGLSLIDFAMENPSHYLVMFGSGEHNENPSPALQKAANEAFMLLYDSIIQCQQERLVKKDDPGDLAVAAWSIVHGFAMLVINGHVGADTHRPYKACLADDNIHRLKKKLVNTLYDGLQVRPGR